MTPFLAALAIIGLAELGDKTQLLTFGFAAKYPFWKVISAVAFATALLMALAVGFGGIIGRMVPPFYLQLSAGVIFLAFGFWSLLGKDEKAEGVGRPERGRSPFWIVFAAFFIAELGDKTQLAALTLSAQYGAPFMVWLGATAAMIAVNLASVLAGSWLSRHLPEKFTRYLGAAVFLIFGVMTLIELFR
jgi:putative Ca2+/H+ antiporter (TMEM165/GDT1 family)